MEYKTLQNQAATGGTITEIGGYRIHTFTSSGTFTVNKSMNIEVLVVGGGGGGGYARGAGGGAGGYIHNSSLSVQTQSYAITIGPGGIGGSSISYKGQNGGNSSIGNLVVALGGGGGGGESSVAGLSGGSGGGSAAVGTGGLTSDPTQGNNGGDGVAGTCCYAAGGGGGAGTVGGNATNTACGNGGAGLNNSISGSLVGYAGGAAGSYYSGSSQTMTAGTATHGGGLGGYRISDSSGTAGSPGTANTGGGGGGGFVSNAPVVRYNGGNGGSGIVIIRYLLSEDLTPTGSLRITSTPSGAGIWLAQHGQTPSWQNTYTPDPIIGLAPGFYDIRLTRSGYEDWAFGNAEIIADTETQISASMVLVSQANITAISMTATPSESPCRQGICTAEVSVTWTNNGGISGTFVPNISIDGTPASPIYSSESLGPGANVTHGFSVSGLSTGTHTICPYPN